MNATPTLVVPDLPFHMGPTTSTSNPEGIPDVLPFELRFDPQRGMLVQVARPELQAIVNRAHRVGLEIGTPLSDDGFGKPYAEDFLSFIRLQSPDRGQALEIGAGVGYLSKCLKYDGWRLVSLEPGAGYRSQWAVHGIDVIEDYFPSSRAPGPFDLICAYAVLEHVPDPLGFLSAVRQHLTLGGRLVLSVPDCSREIELGDPAMLIHEHYNYFDPSSLQAVLHQAGFSAQVRRSGYGRAIYASAMPAPIGDALPEPDMAAALRSYPARCEAFIRSARSSLTALAEHGTVGIYCPSRALAIVPPQLPCRFFDDAPNFHGKYVPPFPQPIESRADLRKQPTDTVVIMSHTFADKLRQELAQLVPAMRVMGIADLTAPGSGRSDTQ